MAELTARSQRADAESDVVHARIKQLCWDDMDAHGVRVTALDTAHFVYNYPLKAQAEADSRRLSVVEFLRGVEHKERLRRSPAERSIMTNIELDKAQVRGARCTEEVMRHRGGAGVHTRFWECRYGYIPPTNRAL